MMRKFTSVLATILLISLPLLSQAQMTFTSGTLTKTENFNSLGTSATTNNNATLPTGFRVMGGTSPVYSSGTSVTTQSGGTSGTNVLTAASSGGTYNFAAGANGSATDRALGFISSSGFTSPQSIMLEMLNSTGATITSLNISFDYEKYRTGQRILDMRFYSSTDGSTWTAQTTGDQNYTASGSNAVVNPATTISKTVTLTGLSIPNNSTFYLRWFYDLSGGSTNGQGVGIDNFSATATLQTCNTGDWTGTASTDWSNAANWCGGTLPTATTDVVIPSAGITNFPVVGTTGNVARNITVNTGATLTIATGGALAISGNITNNGTLNAANGDLAFNGTTAQTMPGLTANSVTINNPAGVTISSDLIITSLTLTAGILNNTGNNTVIINNTAAAAVTGGSSTSYVNGAMTRLTSAVSGYVFPTGKNNTYAPVTVTPTTAAASSYTVDYLKAFKNTPNYAAANAPLISVNASEYFNITRNSGSDADITLPWNNASGVTDQTTIVVAHYNGSSWDNLGGTPTGTTASGSVTVTGVSSFSPFAIGSTTPQPLPVHLVSFTLNKENNTTKLNWELRSMEGSETVTVERSADAKTFTALTTMPVAKQSIVKQAYTDASPAQGINYYRLAIKEGNGSTTYSKTLSAVFSKESTVSIYPNPAHQSLQVDWMTAAPATIELRNTMGQVVYSTTFAAGTHAEIAVDQLTNGAYILTWKQGSAVKHQQIQVTH